MDIVVLAIVVLPVLIAIGALVTGRDRWGARRVAIARGDGAYRAGAVFVPVQRSVPVSVTVAALASWVWGALTLFVFVPAGAVLAIVSLDQARGAGAVIALVALVIVLSGVAHAFALFVAGTQVARHHPQAATTAKKAGVFARWHHAAVLLGFSFCALLQQVELAAVALAVLSIPCGIGAIVGGSLHAAAARIGHIDREEASERHRQLFVLAPTEVLAPEGPNGSAPGARTEGPGAGEPILEQA